ncbi:TetR/AcrR family transcriptional regulator [Paenirhodobacter populi]|nr:TetR/AcrR family transcriptional regulator [Sinirhodobacter populi]
MTQNQSRSRASMMAETRDRLLAAGRKAFAKNGFSGASMDDLTAEVGLTRGALYHHFGDKKGLLAAVVAQLDGEMAARAMQAGESAGTGWAALEAQGAAYIEAALDPEVQRIVLLDGPAVLGDPSQWPSQNACLEETQNALIALSAQGLLKPVDIEAAARLLNGAALNAALWIAASDDPPATLPKAQEAFKVLASGFMVR